MTNEEIDRIKYFVCCPMCDNKKCVKGTNKCEAEIWAKRKRIQVVIDIPNSIIVHISDGSFESRPDDKDTLISAVMDGIPLPKGHGRLVDADALHTIIEDVPIKDDDKWYNIIQKVCLRIGGAPTIIEADAESEDEK